MSTTQGLARDRTRAKRRHWPRRVAYGAALAAALGAGIGIGAATGVSQATYNASQAQVSSLKGQVSSLSSQVSTLQEQVSSDNAAVAAAQGNAATAVNKAYAAAAQALREPRGCAQPEIRHLQRAELGPAEGDRQRQRVRDQRFRRVRRRPGHQARHLAYPGR